MSIRLRFTLWATAIMLAILLALSLGVNYMMARNLQADMDQRLRNVYESYIDNPELGIDTRTGDIIAELAQPDPFAAPGLYIQSIELQPAGQTGAGDFQIGAKTSNLRDENIPVSFDTLSTNLSGSPDYYNASIEGVPIRVYSAAVASRRDGQVFAVIQVAESREQMLASLSQLRTMMTVGILAGTVLVAGAAWFVADAAMRPLRRMAATARAIGGARDLSQRVDPPQTNDEVERLAETFNAMLDRLEDAFDAQRQFVADASHELRTPLTALRGNTDILLGMVRSGRIDQQILDEGLSDVSSEAARLTRLVHDLLTLARADVGWRPEMDEVDLTAAVEEALRIAQPLAREHELITDIPDERLLVRGNADQLRQLMLILLDNAFTHTPSGSSVKVRLDSDGDEAVIEVEDSGPGFPEEHQDRIFDRFYRTDGARARSSGGTGLGLAIARWIADIHDGEISARSMAGHGSTFTVRLPIESIMEPTPGSATKDASQDPATALSND